MQGFFHPADRLMICMLSVQPCAGRAVGVWGEEGMGKKVMVPLTMPGCCRARKDGFVLKNPLVYIGGGRGKVHSARVGCTHLLTLAVLLQRLQSLHSFSIASCSSPPCVKHMHRPWISMGAGRKGVIPATCPLCEQQQGRFISRCKSTSSICERSTEVSRRQ